MALAAGALAILTWRHLVTPWVLLTFIFILGLGAVMNDPAWQAITPEVVSTRCHAPAVALNSVGFNVARSVGPALGGLVIAWAGLGAAFFVNALSFLPVVFFLRRWQRSALEPVETGRVRDAIRAGIRYGFGAPMVRSVLVRTLAFSLAASSLLALLPILARPHGATGYGLLLGSFGLGALAGASILPRLRRQFSVDTVVVFAVVVFAVMTFAAGRVGTFHWLSLVLFAGGTAWIAILACLNIAAQTMSPPGMRARALSMYLLVLQGGMAVGSASWGALANKVGIPAALLGSAVALIIGLATVGRYPLSPKKVKFTSAVLGE
jgi:predicted MFS family arabinose efflux permease